MCYLGKLTVGWNRALRARICEEEQYSGAASVQIVKSRQAVDTGGARRLGPGRRRVDGVIRTNHDELLVDQHALELGLDQQGAPQGADGSVAGTRSETTDWGDAGLTRPARVHPDQ